MAYESINTEIRGRVGLIRFDRSEAMNALNTALLTELAAALSEFESDEDIGAMVITGDEKAFAAGADIRELAERSFTGLLRDDDMSDVWQAVGRTRKPVIAAVSGYALGGGCELALACDIILAAESARFGLPEITIGVIPGTGGTQRIAKALGKAKAMEMVLTGRFITAEEAEQGGLVSRIVTESELVDEAVAVGEKIASMSLPAVLLAKQAVNRAFETTLAEGMAFERNAFYALFATEDQKEGMAAFIDKRQPQFRNR